MKMIAPSYLFLFVFSLMCAAGTQLEVAPLLRQVVSLQAQVETAQTDLNGIQGTSGAANAYQRPGFQSDSRLASILLPTADNQYELIAQIETAVKGIGLPLTGVSVTPAATGAAMPAGLTAGMKALALSISTKGSYADMERLVSRLASLDRYLTVNEVSLTAGQDGTISAQISAYAYYLKST